MESSPLPGEQHPRGRRVKAWHVTPITSQGNAPLRWITGQVLGNACVAFIFPERSVDLKAPAES